MESEKADFSFEKIQEKHKDTGTKWKNFSVSPRKRLEKYPDCQERHVRNWVTESKKSGFFFQKSSKKAKKLWKQTENFLSFAWKKQQIFTQAEGKMQKRTGKKQKNYLSNHPKKGMKNIRPIGINSVINGRSG